MQQKVKRILFSRKGTAASRVGGRSVGEVYAGKAVLEGGQRKAIAIKLFKKPLTDVSAAKYQQTITDLVKAGVKIPRMMMIRLPKGTKIGSGELQNDHWAQVSQLFGSTRKGSKLARSNLNFPTRQAKEQAVQEFTKIANAGYMPVADAIELIKTKKGTEAIPVDIDYIAFHGKIAPIARAREIAQNILKMTNGPTKEYSELLEVAIKTSSNEMRQWLEEERLR